MSTLQELKFMSLTSNRIEELRGTMLLLMDQTLYQYLLIRTTVVK